MWYLLSLPLYNSLMVSTIVKEAKGLISGQKCILEKCKWKYVTQTASTACLFILVLRDSNNKRD